jgi:purine nucleoside permease
MRRLLLSTVAALALVVTALAVGPAGAGSAKPQPRALVIATFGGPDAAGRFTGEAAPWEANEHLTRTLTVPGLAVQDENPAGEVHCTQSLRLCVTVVGTTKSKSGPGTAALLSFPGWDLSKAHFLLVGIAGIATWNGTIGDAAIGNIVDTNLGTDYVRPGQGGTCAGWDPFDVSNGSGNPYTQATYNLPLSDWAFNLTKNVKLAVGGDAVIRERAFYGAAEKAEKPRVRRGGVGGHDSFWVGRDQARRQDCIYAFRAKQFGLDDQRITSAFEDPGVAGALIRRGRLGDLVVVRTGSDFEDQRPGTTPHDLYELLHSDEGFAAFGIAVENEWRVGRVIAHAWAG